MSQYCIDANIFIEAKNNSYPLDMFPAFWEWINRNAVESKVFSSSLVYSELSNGNDDLAEWISVQSSSSLFREPSPSAQEIFGRISQYVSDKHRTIIDMLDTPEVGGGIVHVTDCFKAYLKDEESDLSQLIDYAKRLGNGAVFKRLGFLAEKHGISLLVKPCLENITTGNAKLDPALSSHRLIKKWNLWIPDKWN